MPANVVKTKEDECLWEKAKRLAEEADQKENWAYVMGIFQRMKGKSAAQRVVIRYSSLWFGSNEAPQMAQRVASRWIPPETRDENLQADKDRREPPDLEGGSQVPPARDLDGKPL